jgi:hypothetical protein
MWFLILSILLGIQQVSPAEQSAVSNKVLEYIRLSIGQKVGAGECADLAVLALHHAGGQIPGNYIWGKEIPKPFENAKPGDILQFRGVLLVNRTDTSITRETMRHHTAVIIEVIYPGLFRIAHQNVSGVRKVVVTTLDLKDLKRGRVVCYRPIPLN